MSVGLSEEFFDFTGGRNRSALHENWTFPNANFDKPHSIDFRQTAGPGN